MDINERREALRARVRNKLSGEDEAPEELIVHIHTGSIDYPRNKNGEITGLIHPKRMNQDWKLTKKGDPLFLDNLGNVYLYKEDQKIWPVFIGEVSYKEKNIAMSFTKKEIIFTSNDWVKEFFS